MQKIAICVSGQTRHFNKDPKYTSEFYEILELFDDYDYDLFGHTWADHEDPHDKVKLKFKEYKSEDQEIIWDTIINLRPIDNRYFPFWEEFFETKEQWYEKPEYMDILKGKSDVNYIDFAKERIKGTVGQVWSAHESFLLTKPYWKENNYSMVVKLRWDLMIINDNKKRFKNQLRDWINKEVDFENMFRDPTCLCADNCVFRRDETPFTNDHLFVFEGKKFSTYSKILQTRPVELLGQLLASYRPTSYTKPHLPAAHTLWMDWILYNDFIVSAKLPNLTQANGPSDNKINKEWNI